jgi:hypothetical protein
MRKLRFLIMTIVCVLLTAQSGLARITAMTDVEMKDVTAQAGITMTAVDQVDFASEIGTIYYGDTDGTDGNAAYLSLTGVSFAGSVNFANPADIRIETGGMGGGSVEIAAIDITLNDMTLDIDHITIDAIRVGSAPGQGASFGSFGIYDMHTSISGNVRISTFR